MIQEALNERSEPDAKKSQFLRQPCGPKVAAARVVAWQGDKEAVTIFDSDTVFDDGRLIYVQDQELKLVKDFLPSSEKAPPEAWLYAHAVGQIKFHDPIRAATKDGLLRGFERNAILLVPGMQPVPFEVRSRGQTNQVDAALWSPLLATALAWEKEWVANPKWSRQPLSLAAAMLTQGDQQTIVLARLGDEGQFTLQILRKGEAAPDPSQRLDQAKLEEMKKKWEQNYRSTDGDAAAATKWNIPLDLKDAAAQRRFIELLGEPDTAWLGRWPISPWRLIID
jgi:hypothetical protein